MFAISPILILVTIGIFIMAVLSFKGIIRNAKEGKPMILRHLFGTGFSSLYFSFIWSITFLVGASLSHNSQPIQIVWPYCLASTLFFVALPFASIFFIKKKYSALQEKI